MNLDVVVTLPVVPRPKRPPTADGGKLFKEGRTAVYEAEIARMVGERIPPDLRLDEPVMLDILAVFPRTQEMDTFLKTKQEYKFGSGAMWHTSRPDWDNLAKSTCDAITEAWFDTYRDSCIQAVRAAIAEKAAETGKGRKRGPTHAEIAEAMKAGEQPRPWRDDSVVVIGTVAKVYAAVGREAMLLFRLRAPAPTPMEWVLDRFGAEVSEMLSAGDVSPADVANRFGF